MKKQPEILFGKLGWMLLIVAIFLIIGVTYFLPSVLTALQLSMPDKWVPITRLVVQITIGSWAAASFISIVRVIVWLRAVFGYRSVTEYQEDRRDVTYVRDFILWLLGIMTALAAYMTQWFGGR